MTLEEGFGIMNQRLRLGLMLICVAVVIFFWSIWLVSWTYNAFSTHCDTVDLWLMLIGTILFSVGMFFVATSDREPDSEQEQSEKTG
jgi:hypothetical protein